MATFASPAPDAPDLDWLAGMHAPDALRAARQGREARARFAEIDGFDPASFTASDWDVLGGEWGAVGQDAGAAGETGPDGLIDDDAAFAQPWGVDPAAIRVPVLIAQGADDRVIPATARGVAGGPDARAPSCGGVTGRATCPSSARSPPRSTGCSPTPADRPAAGRFEAPVPPLQGTTPPGRGVMVEDGPDPQREVQR